LREWRGGAVKLFVTTRGLHARRAAPALFVDGEYLPLSVHGEYAANVVAFARRLGDELALAVVPRLTTQLTRPPVFPVGAPVWGDTSVELPDGGRVAVADALADLPVALLTPAELASLRRV
jgi:(1->4)-alpha-D-glucan 1-alpha-D-glucosylmutase